MPALDALPGFRRRFRVTPTLTHVRAEVEDDYHHMGVVVHHQDGVATKLEPLMIRAPWSTCPGAVARLTQTFTGVALANFAARGEKQTNCTHLHDLALLAAAHAGDGAALSYEILVSDPVDGRSVAELRRDGAPVLGWTLAGFEIVAPTELAGLSLGKLRAWMDTLDEAGQEQARILRWGSMIAHGRAIPIERQSDASRFPANCHTFQPENAIHARRIGEIREFSGGGGQPLDARP
jgi:hypothetical protein